MRTTHSTSPDSGASGLGNTMATARGGIFWRFAARSLKLNKSRTIVSIIGIALSCALITAIFTSVATLYSGLLKAEILR
jgi:putative ABC transport system permease protein